jgi:D-threo-aldose 1-dehydrogenase
MQRRRVPGTGLELTELGFGGAAIGNLYRSVDTATAHAALEAAWHAGIRVFDTAPHYGLGLSERRIGAALVSRPRDGFVVSSKVGRVLERNPRPSGRDTDGFDVADILIRRWDFSEAGVHRSIEDTLERMGLDRLDIVYVHDPDDHWEQASTQAMPALAKMRDEGLIGAIGAGMNQSAMLARFLRETPADLVMLAGRYTLLEQEAQESFLPLCHILERLISVFIPVGYGSIVNFAESPETVFDNVREVSPHVFTAVPRVWEKVYSRGMIMARESSAGGKW